jgi:hypothetical protein
MMLTVAARLRDRHTQIDEGFHELNPLSPTPVITPS